VLFAILAALALAGCASDDDGDARGESHDDAGPSQDAGYDAALPEAELDLQELLELGIDEYLGAASPIGSETITGVDGIAEGSVVYDFDPEDGPVCLRGAPYNVSLLDQGSDNLVIFLQGGGACVSILCSATTEATPRGVPAVGVLDTSDPENPVASWNVVYVPYCDGSVFGGDNDFENPNDAMGVRLHHGQRNFSAALDLAVEHFPNAKKVLLAGSSAGGWGTIYHRSLVRSQYPDAELTVLNDAGIGFQVNTAFVADEWGATRHRPASCEECQTYPHLSYFVRYQLEHDPATLVGDFSAWEDSSIMRFTFVTDAMQFRTLLQEATDIPASAFPDRYKRFFIAGSSHTALMRDFHGAQVNGITLAQWLGLMIDRDPAWTELLQQ
jgi:hypothetical protein